jgi:hypothetical protein
MRRWCWELISTAVLLNHVAVLEESDPERMDDFVFDTAIGRAGWELVHTRRGEP